MKRKKYGAAAVQVEGDVRTKVEVAQAYKKSDSGRVKDSFLQN